MKPLMFDSHCYRIGGKPVYLCSGEFHYFRVPRKDWRRRMRLFREAGGNCLATYVPWLLHEPREGRFVFGGKAGTHDLEGFLETAADEGLYVIARPGPYQYSELKHDGLPGWLCEGYPALRAHDIDNHIFRTSSISYLHPLFLEKVERWFDAVCPRIARHTISRGGPVMFTQFDNELGGIHTWFGGLDYNRQALGIGKPNGRYPQFLMRRYGSLARLNAAYGLRVASFAAVTPVRPGGATVEEIRRARDYFEFYLETLAEYAAILASLMRGHGIDTPLVHNSANPGMNAWFTPMCEKLGASFLLGSDHYYNLNQDWGQNNPTPQYAVTSFVSLEQLRLMGYPPTVFELPGGSPSDFPPFAASDARTCYWTNLAMGMKGSNYYIFTGGPNVKGTGVTSDVYDFNAAIGPWNEIRPLYAVQKEFGCFLRRHPWLMEAEGEYSWRVALDGDLARAGGESAGLVTAFEAAPRDSWRFLQRGFLTSAFSAGLLPRCIDGDDEPWPVDVPVVLVTSTVMRRARQQQVVRFLQQGGSALLLPVIPTLDENLRPCTVLSDYLGGVRTLPITAQYARVSIAGVANIHNNGAVYALERLPARAQKIGLDEMSGKTLAATWTLPEGGRVLVVGFRWTHSNQEHTRMLTRLARWVGVFPRVVSSDPNVWVTLRTAGERTLAFVMNLWSAPGSARIGCRPARCRRPVDLGRVDLPPMSVKVLSV